MKEHLCVLYDQKRKPKVTLYVKSINNRVFYGVAIRSNVDKYNPIIGTLLAKNRVRRVSRGVIKEEDFIIRDEANLELQKLEPSSFIKLFKLMSSSISHDFISKAARVSMSFESVMNLLYGK